MNAIQRSIQKTRLLLTERKRQIAVAIKQSRQAAQQRETQLELLVDTVCAETGLPLTTENMPAIALFVRQAIADQHRTSDEDDEGGMQDHNF
jgi:hypothetical protein